MTMTTTTSAIIESLRAEAEAKLRRKAAGSVEPAIAEREAAPEPAKPKAKGWPSLAPRHSTTESFYSLFPEAKDAGPDFQVPTFRTHHYPAHIAAMVPKGSDYIADPNVLYQAVAAYATGLVCRLVGWPGTGKSEGLPVLVASRLGMPLLRLGLNKKGMMLEDLIGRESIVAEGGVSVTKHKDGVLCEWVQHPSLILLDEFCRSSQEITNGMMSLMERNGKLLIENRGAPITRHLGCWLLAADNVKGLGDDARMVGTEAVDGAVLDRFDVTVEVDYLSVDKQTALLEQWLPGLPEADKLAKFAKLIQDSYKRGQLPLSLSPRGLRAIATIACMRQGYEPAVRSVLLQRFAEEADKQAICDHFRTAFGRPLTP